MAIDKVEKTIELLKNPMMTREGAMIEAGYSETYARSSEITKTKGWQEVLEKELPDGLLLRIHKDGLQATKKMNKIVGRDADGHPEYELVDIDDHPTRHKFLETAYKIKKKTDEQPVVNEFALFIQQIINEPKGDLIRGGTIEDAEEVVKSGVEIKQSLLHSKQARSESPVQTEQTTDLLTSEPSL